MKEIGKVTEANKKATDALREQAAEVAKQRASLRASIETMGMNEIAIARLAAKKTAARLEESENTTNQDPDYQEALRNLLFEQTGLIKDKQDADFSKRSNALKEQVEQSRENNALLQQEVNLTGMSQLERGKINALRAIEVQRIKELVDIEKSGHDEPDKQTLRNQINEKSRIDSENAVQKLVQEDWQKTADQINASLTDAFTKSLESGKDFGKNLREALKEQFKSLVLKPTISAMMSPISGALSTIVTGAMGGSASASGGAMGLLNGASTLNSAYNLYNGGMSSLTAPGSMYYNFATSSFGQTLGLSNSAPIMGNNISAFMPQGTQLTSPLGLTGQFTSANSIGGMGVMGTAGVVALVAAVVLNAVGAFRSDTKIGGGLAGTLGGGQLQPWEEWRTGGTLFDGSSFETHNPLESLTKYTEQLQKLRDAGEGASSQAVALQAVIYQMTEATDGMAEATRLQSDAIQAGYKALRGNVVSMADSLGLAGDSVKTFAYKLENQDLNFDGLNAEGVQKKIAEALKKGSNAMAETLIGSYVKVTKDVTSTIQDAYNSNASDEAFHEVTETVSKMVYVPSEFAKPGEKAIDTLTRLSTSFSTLNEASDALGFGIHQGSLILADFADDFIEAFGGLERFTASTGAFLQNYYSDEERRQYLASSGSRRLEKLGINVSAEQLLGATGSDIRNAVNSVVSNPELYGDAMDIANYLAPLYQGAAQAAPAVENLSNAVDELTQKFTGAKDALINDAKSLAVELLRAQGKEGQAKALERTNYLAGFSDLDEGRRQELAAGYDANAATRRAIDAQNERNGLQSELNALTDDSTQALTRQRDALDESNRALFDNVQAVKLQKTLAEELPGVLSKYMLPAQRRKAQYESTAADLTAAGIHVTGDQLANASKEQFAAAAMSVYNLGSTTDGMRLALVRAAGAIADIKDAEVDAAFANLQRVVGLELENATKTRDEIKAVFDLLQSSVDELYSEVDSTARLRAAEGQDYIAKTLAAAQSGGKVLDSVELGKAISAARSGLDGTQYTSQFERDKERLVLAGKLSDLEDISGEQLSEAEEQVESLKRLVDNAQKQIDELRGINEGVDTVGKALKALAEAIGGRTTDAAATPPKPSNVIKGEGQASFNTATGIGTTKAGVEFERQAIWDAAREVLTASPDGSGAMSVYKALESGGYSLADYNTMFGMPAGTLEAEAQKLGMKVFHRGTPFVPSTGFALLQRGEAVIPTAYNPFVHGRSLGDTARLEAHLEKLTGEVMRLQNLQTLGNTHAQATVELLDNVTEGGNGIRAEIMNKVELVA